MNDSVINEIIASDPAPVVDAPEPVVETVEDQTTEGTEPAETTEPASEETREVWPKKAENALARAKKEQHKLRAEVQQMRQQLLQMQAQQAPKVEAAPQEDQFETVLDYLKAQTSYEARKAAEDHFSKQSKQTNEHAQQAQFMAERGAYIDAREQELAKTIPDVKEVIENSEELFYLPDNIKEMFIMSDNPSLAAYNLIKEGKIGRLAHMHPQLVAAEIVRAQSQMPAPKQTSAPQPMRGVVGAGVGGTKKPEGMSPTELMKWINS